MPEKLRFVFHGKTLTLNSFGSILDQAFIELHSAYFGLDSYNWDGFDLKVLDFLKGIPNRNSSHNLYFGNFTIIWNNLLANGNFDEAERIWQLALKPVLEFETNNPGRYVHKGTAYYFWGMTVILRGDLDKGYALVHQALEEDIETSKSAFPDTPAFALASLNYVKLDQAFRHWVASQAQYLDILIKTYSLQYSRNFTLDDLRNRFLNSPPSTEIVFLFVYTLARLMRIFSSPTNIFQSRFSGQLLLNIFFDITVIIEAIARTKNPKGKSFLYHSNFISRKTNNLISINKLKKINSNFNNNFEITLKSNIDGAFIFKDATNLTRLQSDIAIAYGIRNKGAHDISSSPILCKEYKKVEQILMNVLFMLVDFT